MAKLASEKYNIILIVLIFVIPLIAIDFSFYYISNIKFNLDQKKQEKEAFNEVETLAEEGNFNTEFALHFMDFFDEIKDIASNENINDSFIFNELKQSATKKFEKPFPKYNLYVFNIPIDTKQAKLLYYEGNLSHGKRHLCKAFEHLYNVNKEKDNKTNESFAKKLLGQLSNINAIAKQMKAVATNIKSMNKASWFIWDYVEIGNKGVFGAFLICDEINNHAEYGRLLALKRLKSKGKSIGAFIPVYKDFGEANILPPLDKSKSFLKWADSLTIKNRDEINFWAMNSLPQKIELGNYSAFCHLERFSSHIAIVLVKRIKGFTAPKWLIFINLFLSFSLLIILYCGIFFGKWPQLKLRTRFILSYALASVVPLSLLTVIGYGYLLKYENTSIELANNKLLLSLKDFDSHKLTNIREYKTTFDKVINDSKLVDLIEKYGINSRLVTDYVVNVFEKSNPQNQLPILGVKIYDEAGEGALSNGSVLTYKEIENIFNTFGSVQVDVLRDEIIKENPNIKLKEFKINEENNLTQNAYDTLNGRELKNDINKLFSTPIPRKNNDSGGYLIFDTIKIHGKTKYMLLVFWDDNTLDERIIKKAIEEKTLENLHPNSLQKKNSKQINNLNHNFIAYKINGQKPEPIGQITRHASKDLLNEIDKLVKKSSNLKKINTLEYENNLIVVMPALNFNQTVFVGWINKIEIILELFNRKLALIILIIISFFTLWICSLRSSSVFLKPITTLKNALDEVSYGNLNIGFKDNPNNELGKLSNEFDKMIEELREKERLSKLISDQAVQALKKNSSGLLNDTETFKGVALVSDIRNFTGMSEKYDPTIITELLNEHFAEMAKIISDNGGLIYKFIGDAIEAVFPEKEELEKTAIERAFQAGCQMIQKLKAINNRRNKIGLLSYRIGVGLCYGTMYSGSVGSLESRLDYSILGDPLKKAAKLEALTIQNPDFPLTLDEIIAEKLANIGLGLISLNSKEQSFKVYTLNETAINSSTNSFLSSINEKINNKNEEVKKYAKDNIKLFSLSTNSASFKLFKNILFYIFLVLSISILITLVIKINFDTTFDNLKSESYKNAARLIEQLKCYEIKKSIFESLCLEFYDDIRKINYDDKTQTLKQKIEQVAQKYEKLGIPIPRYCCCFLNDDKKLNSEKIIYKGFSNKICMLFKEYTEKFKIFINDDDKKAGNIKESIKKILTNILEKNPNNLYNMKQTFYRRSSPITIDGEKILFNTDLIYDKTHNNLLAYIFCGFPDNKNIELSPNYYTFLAGKELLLAMRNKDGWYFSPGFPENEKELFKNNSNNTTLDTKGYLYKKIDINNKTFMVYIISRDLLSYFCSDNKLLTFTFIISVLVFSLIFWFLEKNTIILTNSIATILRKDIFLSAILPLLTVSFVSYLYVEEDSNVNKYELLSNLNQQINEIENREYYYSPFMENFFKNLPQSKEIQDSLTKILNSKDKERTTECDKLSNYLKKKLIGRAYKKNILKIDKSNTYIDLKEIIFVGKDGWTASAIASDKEDKSSPFGGLVSKIVKTIYFEKSDKINHKNNTEDLEGEFLSEKFLNALGSTYGSDVSLRISNFPNNLIIVSNSYSSIGLYIGCFPNINNPDYALVALIFFDNEYKSDICNNRNDNKISYKAHLASNSKDDKIYCFYSTNLNVGNYFFLDEWYNNKREERKTVKELGLVASWITTSYLPLSRKININGTHFLEARQGNFIKDNVYASITSDYSINKTASINIKTFVIILLFSLLMILLIAQSITLDLLEPVKQLIKGAGAASKGEYKFRTNFTRNDELGTLCYSFNKMMKGLEEKQLMNRMVSKTALKVASDLSEIQSRKVDVALLYVTVPDFDKIMKQTSPFELFYKLKNQIAIISEIVINNGGDIDKIMGEKMLIAFRLGNKTSEQIAVEAAKVAILIENCDKLQYKVSVGVNYGTVISGYLGVGEKQDFTIIGDPVNVAARIAVFAEKLESNRLILSEKTMELVKNQLELKEFGEVMFKGKTQPSKVYQIV